MTASCQDARDLIPLYPQDLEPTEATLVTEHVASCAPCATELAVYASQAARFRDARGARHGKVDLWAGIQAELAKDANDAARGPRGLVTSFPRRLGYVAAAAALVGGLAVALHFAAPAPAGPTTIAEKPTDQPKQAPSPLPASKGDRPVLVDRGEQKAPTRPLRRPRTFFTNEDAMPLFGGAGVERVGERELIPLEPDEAIVPGSSRRRYAQQGAEPESRGARERAERESRDPDRSLSF